MDAAELKEAFESAAREAGYEDAQAEIVEAVHLKLRWVRSSTRIRLEVSDYLLALTYDVACALAAYLMSKIMGTGLPDYPPEVLDGLMSDGFAAANQATFIERLGIEDKGDVPILEEYKDLAEEQGAAIPSGIRVLLAPPHFDGEAVSSMMRVAVMPRTVAKSSRKARLAWIEEAVVTIGKGPGVEGAPDRYVEVARMGNRAVITTREDLDGHGDGVYLHWNGGRDSVAPLLEYCRLRGFRGLPDPYGYARLAQVMANFLGGEGLSIGVGPVDALDQDNYDNGVYVVRGWEIVDRLFFDSEEQHVYDRLEFLRELDAHQPEGQQIGAAMMDDLLRHGTTLDEAGGGSYHFTMLERKLRGEAPVRFEKGRAYLRYKHDRGEGFEVIGKDGHTVSIRLEGEVRRCPLFHWADGGESILLHEDGHESRAVEPVLKG